MLNPGPGSCQETPWLMSQLYAIMMIDGAQHIAQMLRMQLIRACPLTL